MRWALRDVREFGNRPADPDLIVVVEQFARLTNDVTVNIRR